MKPLLKASLLIFLIITLPICFAQNLVYDANGNLVTGDGFYRVYNSLNQLYRIYNGSNTSILLEEYVYHPIEERVWIKKTFNASGNVTETVYYLSKEFVMLVNKTGTFNFTYVYMDDRLVAQILTSNGVINQPDGPEGDGISPLPSEVTTTQFILTDHKGSVVAVTNASGSVIENSTYSPYGQIISGGSKSRYDYEGKEYDSVTKTLDFHFRKINPNNQFWEQPDDRIYPYDPQKLNRYMFERGNPWKNTDPTGHDVEAEAEFERWVWWKALEEREEKLNLARQELHKELFNEWKEVAGENIYRSCIGEGCAVEIPTFGELQKKDLQKNLNIVFDDKGKILEMKYRGSVQTKNQLIEKGFAPYILKKEIKTQQKKFLQEKQKEKSSNFWKNLKQRVTNFFKNKAKTKTNNKKNG